MEGAGFPPNWSEAHETNRILVFVAAVERQPHMEAALHHLQEAQEELQMAEHNKVTRPMQ